MFAVEQTSTEGCFQRAASDLEPSRCETAVRNVDLHGFDWVILQGRLRELDGQPEPQPPSTETRGNSGNNKETKAMNFCFLLFPLVLRVSVNVS